MNPKFGVWMHLGMVECHVPFTGHFLVTVTLTSDLVSRMGTESGA